MNVKIKCKGCGQTLTNRVLQGREHVIEVNACFHRDRKISRLEADVAYLKAKIEKQAGKINGSRLLCS